jgi:hypothetical protein
MLHKHKSINATTGVKNPTIVNNSWGYVTDGMVGWKHDIRSIQYRGTTITPESLGNTPDYQGISGVCSTSTTLAALSSLAPGRGNRISTSASTASVTPITFIEHGTSGLSNLDNPTTGDTFFGYYQVSLPFNIRYLGVAYSSIYVNTKGFVTFGEGVGYIAGWGLGTGDFPELPKIMIGANLMNSTERLWVGVSGTTGSRMYTVRVEQTYDSVPNGYAVKGSPTIVWEMTFYEATPAQIDLHIVSNAQYRAVFTQSQLDNYGITQGTEGGRFGYVDPGMDADISDAIADGIIFVCAAGNFGRKQDIFGGNDYNNSFVCPSLQYSFDPYYYHRGGSPFSSVGVITVGSSGPFVSERKSTFSDCGPRIDLYAPGENIVCAYYSGNDTITRANGTSFASPHVCGILACALERNPHWSQSQATGYIKGIAKKGVMTSNSGGYTDLFDLLAPTSNFAYYRRDRLADGRVYPRENQSYRPSTGQVYPRTKIVRYGK